MKAAPDLAERVERLLLERVMADVSRARRAGRAVAGFVKVEQMIGRRRAGLLLVADGADGDGLRKLQATGLPLVNDKRLRLLGVSTAKRLPTLPDTPTVYELAPDDRTRAVLGLVIAPVEMNRPIFTTPDVPSERVEALRDAGANHFCLDVAHGHAKYVGRTLKLIREMVPNGCLMAGNVATYAGADYLASVGADIIKVEAPKLDNVVDLVGELIISQSLLAQEVNRDETKPKVVNAVTLEVTPSEAEKLDLARSVGTLSLALRNQVDPARGY